MRHMTPCHKKKCNGINKSFPTQNKRTKNKIIYKITSEASLRSQQQTRNISNLRELGFGWKRQTYLVSNWTKKVRKKCPLMFRGYISLTQTQLTFFSLFHLSCLNSTIIPTMKILA